MADILIQYQSTRHLEYYLKMRCSLIVSIIGVVLSSDPIPIRSSPPLGMDLMATLHVPTPHTDQGSTMSEELSLAIDAIIDLRTKSQSLPPRPMGMISTTPYQSLFSSAFEGLKELLKDAPSAIVAIDNSELAISRELELPKSPRSLGSFPILRIITELDHLIEALKLELTSLHATVGPGVDLNFTLQPGHHEHEVTYPDESENKLMFDMED